MLQKSPVYAYIPASDVARARKFYEEKLGFKAVIPKPFTLSELSKTLHAVMSPHSLSVH